MNLNANQVIAIFLVVLGVLTASTAQLTDLVGPGPTKIVVSLASLMTSILGGVLGVLTGQSGMVKAVQAMQGIEKITVNASANSALATLAVDPAQDKIEAMPGAGAAVAATARSAGS